ncbi:MAG: tetratricopeptide repeat protein [Planctomycetes bacterium]|nr:tetratricopeptide repeat protein [Planctomycetota bacterium]
MTINGDDKANPGSIAEVTQGLLLWAKRRVPVLLRVEFIDELARKQVVQNLKKELQTIEIPVHEIELPALRHDELAQWLTEELEKLPPGVASINGFATALPDKDPQLQQSLSAINLRREVFASFPLCQIWWMPQYRIDMFAGRINDLNSWFRLRAKLTETVSVLPSGHDIQFLSETTMQPLGLKSIAGLSHDERSQRIEELEHLLSKIQSVPENQRDLSNEKRLLKSLAEIFYVQAQYNKIEPLLRRLLSINEASFGPDHPDVALSLNNLAQLLQDTNRLDEAEPLMRRALAIDEASFGADHPAVATRLNNLASLLQDTNRLDEAEPLIRRALAIDETSFGLDHPKVAIILSNLAQLLVNTNRLDEAEPLMRRALEIDETSFGPDHPTMATRLNNLAQLLANTNRLDEAEPLMRRVLTIDEVSFGPDHPNVAMGLNNMAALLQATNRLNEAEPLMRRALAINEASFGPDHPKVAIALNNLAQLLQATNRLDKAEPLMRRAMAIDESSFGPNHPDVAIDLNNLAQLLKATNRLDEAEPLMKRHVMILLQFARRTGHRHPHLKDAINNYGNLLMQMGCSKDEVTARLKKMK